MSSEGNDGGRRTSRKDRSSSSGADRAARSRDGRIVKVGAVRAGSRGSSAGHSSGHDRSRSSGR